MSDDPILDPLVTAALRLVEAWDALQAAQGRMEAAASDMESAIVRARDYDRWDDLPFVIRGRVIDKNENGAYVVKDAGLIVP